MEPLENRRLFAASAVEPFLEAGVLHVGGTNKSDVIVVTVNAELNTVTVVVNGVSPATPFAFTDVTQVSISGGNGHDEISVVEEGTIPSTLGFKMTGGNGKDTLDGGAGNDSIIGGKGKDNLTGGDGADHFVNDKNDKLFDADTTVELDTVDVVNEVKPKGPKGPKK